MFQVPQPEMAMKTLLNCWEVLMLCVRRAAAKAETNTKMNTRREPKYSQQ